MACSLVYLNSRGQAIALIDENDSLIIKQNLQTVVVSDDKIDGHKEAGFHYSENIDDVLDNQNGISLIKRGNYAAEVVNRGMSSERMNTTINGMKIFSACTDKMDPVTSYVATNNLESFDLANGGEGKYFGSNTGGLLNMNTKEAVLNDSRKIRANISTGFNTVSSGYQASFNTNYSEKNWALRLNGMFADHDNYYAGGRKEIQYSQYTKGNFGASLKTKLSTKDYVLIDYIKDDARNVGYPALPMDVSSATADIFSVTYRRFLTGNWSGKLNAKFYGNNIVHIMDDSERDVIMHMDMPGLSETIGSYLLLELNERNRHTLSANIDAYQNRSYAEMTMYPEGEKEMYMETWPDVYRQMIGVYLSDKFALNEISYLRLSGRIDVGQSDVRSEFGRKQLEVFGYDIIGPISHNTGNIALEYGRQLDDIRRLSIETAYAERLPSVTEQFAFYIFNAQDGYDYIGDPYIKDEKSYSVELKYREERKSLNWGVNVFAYHMPDYIFGEVDPELSAMTIGANGVKRFINLEYARMTGFEADLSWTATQWLRINSVFTYNYGLDNENRPLQLMSPFRNTTDFILNCKKNIAGIKIISAAEQDRYNGDAGENSTPAYAIVNMHYQRLIPFNKSILTATAGIDNLFDETYRDHLDWVDIPRPGRNFFIKVGYQF